MADIHHKYQKVKTLARRGATEGERAAAREAMKRMEAAHPELLEPVQQQREVYVRRTVVVFYNFNGTPRGFYNSGSSTGTANTTSWHEDFFR